MSIFNFKRSKLAILLGVALSTQVLASAADSFVVEDIEVRGLNRVSLGAVLLAFPIKVGDTLDGQNSAQALKRLYETGNFDNVSLSREGKKIIIDVIERPTIGDIIFAGNSQVDEAVLKDVIDQQGLKSGEALSLQTLNQITKSLEDFYHSGGMYQAKVKAVLTYLPRNRVDIKLEFSEGVSAEIKQINIIGNKVFDEDVLLAQMQLRDDVPFWNFIANKRYDAQKLRGDLESIRSYYLNRGYADAKIENTSVNVSPDKKGLYLSVTINEGEKYTVGKVNLRGNTLGYEESMKVLLDFEENEVYNASHVAQVEQSLKNFLGKYGYANSVVKAYPVFDKKNNIVDLDFYVEPGSRVYVSQVLISGNTVTDDTVIRREIRQMEGTWLSNEAMDLSKNRLNRTGFFETVDMKTVASGATADTVNLETTVKEQPTGAISGGVGYGTNSGLLLQIGISQNNVFGWGSRASIQAYDNDYRQHIELAYTDPYFTIDQISLGGRVYYDKFEGDEADVIAYDNETIGLGISSGYPLSENMYISYGLGYENNTIKDTGVSFLQGEYFWKRYGDNGGKKRKSSFNNFNTTFSFSRNNLDKSVLPTSGSRQNFSVFATIPGSDTQYYKITADTSHYFPIDDERNFVLSFRARAAYGDGYGRKNGYKQILPYFDNFYLGGNEWLRGFSYNSIGNKAIYRNSNGDYYYSDENSGGNALWAASFEFIVPTPLISENYKRQVRTSLFLDAGALWDTYASKYKSGLDYNDASDYRASVGVSVAWVSPIGPLVFSLAKPIKDYDGDETETFNFNIGGQF